MRYTADEIKNWETDFYSEDKNRWLPARPENYKFASIQQRIKFAWGVFTGKFDVLDWQDRG